MRPAPAACRTALPLVALALALAGCTGSDGQDAVAAPAPTTTYTADVPVLLPGAPGEPARTLAPGETGTVENPGTYGEAEVAFVTDMVPHHAQALEMAALAPTRAADPRVKALAARIAAGQGPEIAAMQAWLESNDLPKADEDAGHGGHGGGHGGMAGMASEADLARLVAAKGTAFDRLFLQLMVRHHEGALEMAERAGSVANIVVAEMVADTGVTQAAEIARMQELLADLPG